MGHFTSVVAGIVVLLALLSGPVLRADPPSGAGADAPQTQPAGPAAAADRQSAAEQGAHQVAERIVDLYMHNKWADLEKELQGSGKHFSAMSREERIALNYIRTAAKDHRPPWWKSCRSSSNISFKANIWGRDFTANYMPTDLLGGMAPIGVRGDKVLIVVTWKPSMVDSTEPAEGYLSKRHGLAKGDIAEAIVWHELGHNYVTNFLPLPAVIELYQNHLLLFEKLQEFYAEMTAIHHSSPLARRASLMFRLDRLEDYDESDGHTRMAHAVGAWILSEALSSPQDWPSFHLPPEVPASNVERQTIVYLYENLDPNFSFAEDRTLREASLKLIRARGDSILRSKGEVPLASRLSFKLMAGDDRELQTKRDAWVKQKLEEAIKAGRADKPLTEEQKKKLAQERTGPRVVIPW